MQLVYILMVLIVNTQELALPFFFSLMVQAKIVDIFFNHAMISN